MEKINFTKNESFRFNISISDRCYDHKPTQEDYKSMTFHIEELNADELLDRITSGYSMCHVFLNNRRVKNNFLYTNALFVDVDDHSQPMDVFLKGCELKPTIAYTTISNGKNGLHRFRLIYVLDEQVNSVEEYKCLYGILVKQIGLEQNKDNCGSVAAQLMNRNSNKSVRSYCSHFVYRKSTIFQKCQLELSTLLSPQYISNRQFCKNDMEDGTVSLSQQVIQDLNNGVTDFL